jgi:hypothetical protein
VAEGEEPAEEPAEQAAADQAEGDGEGSEGGSSGSGLFSKLGGIAKGLSKAKNPTKIIPGSGVKKNLLTGAALGVGAAAGSQLIGAGKEWGTYLFIGGLGFWLLKFLGLPSSVLILVAWLIFFISVPVVMKGKVGWGYPLIFFVWYYYFSGDISQNSLTALAILAGFILIFDFILTRAEAFKDFSSAVILVSFFFLEIGALAKMLVFVNLGIDPLAESMIFFMPWWAYLGLFKTETENFILKSFKVIGFIYVFFLLIFSIPNLSISSTSVIGGEELLANQQALQDQLPDGEPIAWSRLRCLGETVANPSATTKEGSDSCVERKQLESKLKIKCKDNMEDGVWQYSSVDECVTEEVKKQEDTKAVAGKVNRNVVEFTTAVLTSTEGTKTSSIQRTFKSGQTLQPFRMSLTINNPYEQSISGLITCNFTKRSESVPGVVLSKDVFDSSALTIETSVLCGPLPSKESEFKEYSEVIFNVELHNLKTISTLKRMFVNKFDESNPLLENAKRTHFPFEQSSSEAPDEFARLNFAFGEPETNPFIEEDDTLLFVSSIENVGNGKISKVNGFIVDLDSSGMYPVGDTSNDYCLIGDGNSITLPENMRKGEIIPLSFCFLEHSPFISDEVAVQDFVIKTFRGQLDYDYQITQSQRIKINQIGEIANSTN